MGNTPTRINSQLSNLYHKGVTGSTYVTQQKYNRIMRKYAKQNSSAMNVKVTISMKHPLDKILNATVNHAIPSHALQVPNNPYPAPVS